MLRIGHANLIAAFLVACLFQAPAASAQDDDLIWTFNQTNERGGAGAELWRHIPETDNVHVRALCGANAPDNASSFIISTDTGDLKNGSETSLRFSGGGREFQIPGRVLLPSSEEGSTSVEIVIPFDHEIWDAFDSNELIAYQIPGYRAHNLPLSDGQEAIRNFLSTCRSLAAGATSSETASGSGSESESGVESAKDAFAAARELNTAEGYQAFINAYPTGFYSDLAKAHLKKLNSDTAAVQPRQPAQSAQPQAQQPSVSPPLATYTVGPGQTPWYNTTYSSNTGSQYVAAVQSGGLELAAICTPQRRVALAVREAQPGQYPQFSERINQAAQRNQTAELTYPGERSYEALFNSVNGRGLVMTHPVATTNGIVRSLMSGQTLVLSQPPFAAIFQLNGSRVAVCNILNACGANPPECNSKPAPRTAQPSSNEGRCSSRSVYVEGRGCILKKFANTGSSRSGGCRSGQIRVDGQCMTRAEAVGFCGPGYRVHRNKCVHQNDIPTKKKAQTQRLKTNEGGTISVAACLRKGMVPEFGYCVEND